MAGLLVLGALFAMLTSVLAMLSPAQQAALISETPPTPAREKVWGHNPAYYSRTERAKQLYHIEEFTVSPYPPESNQRIFFYLRGSLYTTPDLPDLANATLELHISETNHNDTQPYFHKNKISEFGLFTVRFEEEEGRKYGGPLVQGHVNELVGDFFMFNGGRDHGHGEWNIEAVAKLPNEDILFAFEALVTYDW